MEFILNFFITIWQVSAGFETPHDKYLQQIKKKKIWEKSRIRTFLRVRSGIRVKFFCGKDLVFSYRESDPVYLNLDPETIVFDCVFTWESAPVHLFLAGWVRLRLFWIRVILRRSDPDPQFWGIRCPRGFVLAWSVPISILNAGKLYILLERQER